jgi:hypothetical protein
LEMETLACATCGVAIVANPNFFRCRRDDHQSFYCISGHGNSFKGKSEAERLRKQLIQEKKEVADLRRKLDQQTPPPRKRGRPRKTLMPMQ